MNRIAAAALASLIALATSACGPAPAPPFTDVTFYWQFLDGDGILYGDYTARNPGCNAANVDEVWITISGPGGVTDMVVPCTNGLLPGVTLTLVPTGPSTWVIRGLRQQFQVFSVTGAGQIAGLPSFDTTLEANHPNMDLAYELPLGLDCSSVSGIRFELNNIVGRVVEYSDQNQFPACRPPPTNFFTMPSIPIGTYGFRFVAAVNVLGQSVAQECGYGLPPQEPIVQVAPSGTLATALLAFTTVTCP
jgi:hypothetical protein